MSKSKQFFAHVWLPTKDAVREVFTFEYNTESEDFISTEGHLCNFYPWSASNHFLLAQTETAEIKFIELLEKSIAELKQDQLKKVVLSRVCHVNHHLKKMEDIIASIAQLYPQSLVYHLNHPEYGEWIGATPELLFSREGDEIETMALAGTLPKESSAEWSEKLLDEHEYVAHDVIHTFEGLGAKLSNRIGPIERHVGPVKHLESRFTFRSGVSNEILASSLHPTSAVCGYPREIAAQWIMSNEPHERRLYCGLIAIRKDNSCSYYVNLRCGQVFNDHLELYAGVGITRHSESNEEWQETERKLETIAQFFK